MSVKTDANAAVSFLKRWSPTDRWVLTSIKADKTGIKTATFQPSQETEARDWITAQNEGLANIYFHVNPVLKDLKKKAEREDIRAVTAFHVDVDPRVGEDFESERARILGLFTDKLPAGVPKPSVIVFSGGGYQGFWFLQDELEVNGDIAKAEDAKRYNQQLERLFGADNCHNIDRIMRLPGTVNWPDAKKQAKGRMPVRSELIEFNDLFYKVTEFVQAPLVADSSKGFTAAVSSGKKVEVTSDAKLKRILDLSELDKWKVPARVKVIIAQGSHPEETKPDNSRSEWLFDACCNLVRANVPDDIIFSIITDPEWGIAASVIDKKGEVDKYAIRQIQRAKEEVEEPWLRELNERHAVIENFGGKCVVVEEMEDHALGDRSRLTKQSFTDFRNRYMHSKVDIAIKDGVPVQMEVGKWWLSNPNRRQYRTLVFVPGRDIPGAYNLWKGFGVEARAGTKHERFLELARDIICAGNEEHYKYLLGWMARLVQQPATAGETSVVMRGGQGIGKGQLMKHFGRLFGRHYLQISDSKHLVGNFNAHLRDCLLLFADEAFFAGDKKHESVLKTLITERHLAIEAKGVDVEQAANFVHVMMASNNEWVVPAGADERRYFVVDVSPKRQGDSEWFGALAEEMASGGYENLLHFLMTYDLTGFEVRIVPKTKALQDQKMLSLSSLEEWWLQKLDDGRIFDESAEWEGNVQKSQLFDNYTRYQQQIASYRRVNQTAFWAWVRKHIGGHQFQKNVTETVMSPNGYPTERTVRPYFWALPDLPECRARWEKRYGKATWTEVKEVQPELRQSVESRVPF